MVSSRTIITSHKSGHVRFTPMSSEKADIAGGPRRADVVAKVAN
jgi:hypothetical protein